jgi:tRNA A-37 threonylcarbamoyl transferase component Bud32
MVVMRLGNETVVAKPALHGGLLAPLLDGLYLGARRARVQIGLAEALRRRGIETPVVLAIGWRRAFGPLVRLALVTRAIPGARNLLEAVPALEPRERRRVLAAAADAVRALHDTGFAHPDLNLANLVLGTWPGGDRVHVVDLDRGRFAGRSDAAFRLRSLARLLRSHDKWVEPVQRLSAREEIRFLRRYCGPDRALLRRLLRGLRRARRRQRVLRALRGFLRGAR